MSRVMASMFRKYVDSLSTLKREGSIFEFFHPETRFQKSVFSGAVFTGSMWTIVQNDAKNVCLHKMAFPCGQPLKGSAAWKAASFLWFMLLACRLNKC